jgi:hypothetical protein
VLDALRDTLPPEAAVRIEALLGTRLSPTLAGLHPLPGTVTTLTRFPDGGGVVRLDGGGLLDRDDGTQQSVVPAVVLVRPGFPLERIDPETAARLGPALADVQHVNGELLAATPEDGPQRWVGGTLLPLLPPPLRAYDRLLGVDARRRWLLADAARPDKTLLIDPGLPDVVPRLPVWTLSPGDAAGWTDADWPAVRHGNRLLVLQAHGWVDGRPGDLRTTPATRPADGTFTVTAAGHVFAYDPAGQVRRYAADTTLPPSATSPSATSPSATSPSATLPAMPEAAFTNAIPRNAHRVWIDPAGRLVIVAPKAVAVAFPQGRVPTELRGLMLRPTD